MYDAECGVLHPVDFCHGTSGIGCSQGPTEQAVTHDQDGLSIVLFMH